MFILDIDRLHADVLLKIKKSEYEYIFIIHNPLTTELEVLLLTRTNKEKSYAINKVLYSKKFKKDEEVLRHFEDLVSMSAIEFIYQIETETAKRPR